MRLDIRRKKAIKRGDETIGSECKVKVVKNKLAPPFREADFEILYGTGVNKLGELVDTAREARPRREVRHLVLVRAAPRSARAATRRSPTSTSTRRCSSSCATR